MFYWDVRWFMEVDVFKLCCVRGCNRRVFLVLACLERGAFRSIVCSGAFIDSNCFCKTWCFSREDVGFALAV